MALPARIVLIALLTVAGAAAPAAARTSHEAAGGHSASAGRATVTATYMALPSGRMRVSVRSDAGRVKLTYRTAAWSRRSKVIRVRNGVGAATLGRGSRQLRARALGTSRLRASARVRVRSNPLLQDADGNAIADYQYDLDTDGRYELVLFDDDRNGRFESVFLDTGATSGLFKDRDENGYFEIVALDADRNGQAERLFYDRDGDGYPELQCLDYVGPDGIADTWVDTRAPSGDPQQDRAAGDLMIQNIVTLNQLRQLDPWSTGYIPYDPAPSLLR